MPKKRKQARKRYVIIRKPIEYIENGSKTRETEVPTIGGYQRRFRRKMQRSIKANR